jgi:Uma2 family endonuclease
MTIALARDTEPLFLNVNDVDLNVTAEQFDRLCQANPDLRLELTSTGKLIVMAPTFGESGEKNFSLIGQVWAWNEKTELGKAFDSSTGYDFLAIGGGKMSPDVSWIQNSRIEGVSLKQFIPVVPDFLVELRSTTDRLGDLRSKMLEYQRLGVRLGLLINPQDKQVEIYRWRSLSLGASNTALEVLESPISISCEDVLPGFVLDLKKIL